MNAKGISLVCCAVAALVLGACSGDSQPTGPEAGGTMLYNGYTLYSDATGETPYDDGSGTTGGSQQSPTSEPVYQEPTHSPGGGTSGSAVTHPIERFLSSQGTFCATDGMACARYMAPTASYIAWMNRPQTEVAAVDYAGLASNWLMQNSRWIGTQITGTVTEQPLADGSARVTVALSGDNVMSFVASGTDFSGKTTFGYQPTEMFGEAGRPALGHVEMHVTFISPRMGEPLPDLVQLIQAPRPGQRLERLWMVYDGVGVVRASGERRAIRIEYNESTGMLHPTHPGSPDQTSAIGTALISYP